MSIDRFFQVFNVSKDNREKYAPYIKFHHFNQPQTVIHKGQSVAGAYIVLSGQLRVFTYSSQGTEATLYLLKPGETCVLTLNCLFNNFRYPAWVETSAATTIALVPGPIYRQLFQQEQHVQDVTVGALSTLVFRLMDELEDAQTNKLEHRLVRLLLHEASHKGDIHMTQQVIASHLGTTREVVARLIKKFRDDKMITTHRGRITISQEKALSDLLLQ